MTQASGQAADQFGALLDRELLLERGQALMRGGGQGEVGRRPPEQVEQLAVLGARARLRLAGTVASTVARRSSTITSAGLAVIGAAEILIIARQSAALSRQWLAICARCGRTLAPDVAMWDDCGMKQ